MFFQMAMHVIAGIMALQGAVMYYVILYIMLIKYSAYKMIFHLN